MEVERAGGIREEDGEKYGRWDYPYVRGDMQISNIYKRKWQRGDEDGRGAHAIAASLPTFYSPFTLFEPLHPMSQFD